MVSRLSGAMQRGIRLRNATVRAAQGTDDGVRARSVLAVDRHLDERRSNELASVLFFVAAALFAINVLPILNVGFWRDDFRNLYLFQEWGGNLLRAVQQDGPTVGFRPLELFQRHVVWNIVGDHPVVHRRQ